MSEKKELGITKEYTKENRDKLWDSTARKTEYKDQVFDGKKTFEDPITGSTLHRSQNAAQNKYHMKNADGENISTAWAKHAPETDHIVSLKEAHDMAKHNPFLSDRDFKEVMNQDANYRVTSKSFNTAKGSKSDWEIVTSRSESVSNSGKVQISKERVCAEIAVHSSFAVKTAENMGSEFVQGAAETLSHSAVQLTAEAVRKMVEVAHGEKSLSEATEEMAKVTVNTAVMGGTKRLVTDIVSNQLSTSKSQLLRNISGSKEINQIIAVVAVVQDSATKYLNGEITGQEFIDEIGEKGTNMVVGMIGGQIGQEIGMYIGGVLGTVLMPGVGTTAGMVAGRVIGEIIGTIITTVACSTISAVYRASKRADEYKKIEKQIAELEAAALEEMAFQRTRFREIVEAEYRHWDNELQAGFDEILANACEESFNVNGVTEGLDKVLGVFGKSVMFKDIHEYEDQLDQPLKLSF